MTPLLQEKRAVEDEIHQWETLRKAKEDVDEWLEFAQAEETQEVLQTLSDQLDFLNTTLNHTEMGLLLSAEGDKAPAILEIHPGAGGTEAQDWAEMLLRMYRRWAERHDFKSQILDLLPADEAGIKSVSLLIKGANAYGLLKAEKGIHRLIRISPFDSSGRRHTSFASVDVYPGP